MIRAAIAGLGRWGRNLVEAAADHPRLKIVRAVEPDVTAAKEFCARHDLDLTADLDAVLADDTIGAVLLATPHSLHPAQVIACAAARKQIFCEKPLALTKEGAEKAAMQLFAFSILYLFTLFAVLLIESGLSSLLGRAVA